MVKDEADRVRKALIPVCEPLHDAFAVAEQVWQQRHPELSGEPEYRWCETHLLRAWAHYRLRQADLSPWKLSGNHRRNGELWMTDDCYSIRVLHTHTMSFVPPPGTNPTRIAYYHNPPLGPEPLFGPVNDKLLALWCIETNTGAPRIRIVRPIGAWTLGSTARTDLDFLLPETGAELQNLFFQPSDEGMQIELPDEQEGGEDVGGLTG